MNDALIFDRNLLRRRRDRVADRSPSDSGFLFREVAARLADRLVDVDRRFDRALELGCRSGEASRAVREAAPDKVDSWVHADLSPGLAGMAARAGGGTPVAVDEECLPFREGRFDLVLSNLAMHWVNDLPGALVQVNRALRPDGLFQGAMLGGETLHELRQCLMAAELEVSGGASPRVSPVADLRDAGALMQRAGFALPVIDSDTITVTYETAFGLFTDLRAMGEANIVRERLKSATPRGLFLRAAALYQERFGMPDGRVPATFQIIYLHGWRPHEAQPKALRPGSAESRLAEALGVEELPAGERAPHPGRPSGGDGRENAPRPQRSSRGGEK